MAGTRNTQVSKEFANAMERFYEKTSDKRYHEVVREIKKASSEEEAKAIVSLIRNYRSAFGTSNFEPAELHHGATIGGAAGSGVGAAYEALVHSAAPGATTCAFGAAGAFAGAAFKFFSAEQQNREKPAYAEYLKFLELERLAEKTELEFATLIDSKSDNTNTSGLRRRN